MSRPVVIQTFQRSTKLPDVLWLELPDCDGLIGLHDDGRLLCTSQHHRVGGQLVINICTELINLILRFVCAALLNQFFRFVCTDLLNRVCIFSPTNLINLVCIFCSHKFNKSRLCFPLGSTLRHIE